jgi:hypothetical protein
VRSHGARVGRGRGAQVDDDLDGRGSLLHVLGWGARDAVGFVVAGVATAAILVNVLFMQTGTHPAPMFKTALPPVAKPVVAADTPTATVPRPRPTEAAPAKAAPPRLL